MRTLFATVSLAASLLGNGPSPDDDPSTEVNPAQSGFGVNVEQENFGNDHNHYSPPDGTVSSSATSDPTFNVDLTGLCLGAGINMSTAPDCDGPDVALEVTPDMAANALAHIPLPPSQLQVQPPNGRTLVNFDTNFFTTTERFRRSVTLLGQRVELDITPESFAWQFGDGHSLSTDSAGSAYPDLEITHRYLRKGRVTPSVDTTYTATYRVNGGEWQPVPGSVTIPGTPVAIRVVTARPQLVG